MARFRSELAFHRCGGRGLSSCLARVGRYLLFGLRARCRQRRRSAAATVAHSRRHEVEQKLRCRL